MIFLGDIACPYERVSAFTDAVSKIEAFKDEIVVLNLEANILEKWEEKKPLTLYNSPDVLKGFGKSRKVIASLANNHMFDYPDKILQTVEKLKSGGVLWFGLKEQNGKTKPCEIKDNGVKMAFFGHCWRLYTQTNKNDENEVGISDAYYEDFVNEVTTYIQKNPETKVYCFMHWNYDLEKMVMPMHRNMAKDLIDAGAEAVIGSHSHRPQGAEIYKGKPIVYGLGNFYLPSGIYFDGKLSYPDYSKTTYALRIKDEECELIWFKTDSGNQPIEQMAIDCFDSQKIKELSPFRDMSEEEYIRYFKKHRSKSLFVPVFDDYKGRRYRAKERIAIARVKVIKTILKILKR